MSNERYFAVFDEPRWYVMDRSRPTERAPYGVAGEVAKVVAEKLNSGTMFRDDVNWGVYQPLQPDNSDEDEQADMVNHPPHYRIGGVEVIELTEHLDFLRGNAVKYLARAGRKGSGGQELEDLRKAQWYVNRAVEKLEKEQVSDAS